jgi:hypothetical protein
MSRDPDRSCSWTLNQPWVSFHANGKTQGGKDMQNVHLKATRGYRLAPGEILVLLIFIARKNIHIGPHQELGIVIKGKLPYFLSDCVLREAE